MRNTITRALALLACIGLVTALKIVPESGPSKYGVSLSPRLDYQELMCVRALHRAIMHHPEIAAC